MIIALDSRDTWCDWIRRLLTGSSLVAQWIENMMLSLLWCRFHPWPRHCHMSCVCVCVWPWKKKEVFLSLWSSSPSPSPWSKPEKNAWQTQSRDSLWNTYPSPLKAIQSSKIKKVWETVMAQRGPRRCDKDMSCAILMESWGRKGTLGKNERNLGGKNEAFGW